VGHLDVYGRGGSCGDGEPYVKVPSGDPAMVNGVRGQFGHEEDESFVCLGAMLGEL
jgi:hypothetical protein